MDDEQGSAGMVRLLGRFLMIPVAAFVYAVEMLLQTAKEIQRATNDGMDVIAGSPVRRDELPESRAGPATVVEQQSAPAVEVQDQSTGKIETTNTKEEKLLSTDGNSATGLDKDLHDDMLKLVRYKILFVRREYEVAFPEKEDLVSDNMDGSAFTAWKIAEFIQDLGRKPNGSDHVRVPQKWIDKKYAEQYHSNGYLTGIPHEDKKYLRVYYEVLERYPREKFKYEEQQIRVLEDIRDELKSKPSSQPASAAAAPAEAAEPAAPSTGGKKR